MSNGNDRGDGLPAACNGPDTGPVEPTDLVERTAIAGELAFSLLSFVDEHAADDEDVIDAAEPSDFAIDGRGLVRWQPRSTDGGRISALRVDDAALRRQLADERRALILTCANLLRGLTDQGDDTRSAPTS